MKEQLIKLAEEKGFVSTLDLNYFCNYLSIDIWFYFWTCELQKWLMDKYKIFAYIDWVTFEYVFIEHGEGIIRESIPNITEDINDWQKWMPGLFIEAMKIIK